MVRLRACVLVADERPAADFVPRAALLRLERVAVVLRPAEERLGLGDLRAVVLVLREDRLVVLQAADERPLPAAVERLFRAPVVFVLLAAEVWVLRAAEALVLRAAEALDFPAAVEVRVLRPADVVRLRVFLVEVRVRFDLVLDIVSNSVFSKDVTSLIIFAHQAMRKYPFAPAYRLGRYRS